MLNAALIAVIGLPALLGPGSFDSPALPILPPKQLRQTAAAGSLELIAHDPRGRALYLADECDLELRREGKRVWRRRLSLGAREIALDDQGRVRLSGVDRREVFGMDATVSVLCFLGADGETIAAHESALPAPVPRALRTCPGDTVPAGGGLPQQRLFPLEGGWTLVIEQGAHWAESQIRWQVYDELGRRLGEVDRQDLVPDAEGDVRCVALDVVPGTRWVVALWFVPSEEPGSTRIVVHDLGARFVKPLSERKFAPLWSGSLDVDSPLLRTEVVHGSDPSVRIGLWKELPEKARIVVRRGSNGSVAVERLEVGEPR